MDMLLSYQVSLLSKLPVICLQRVKSRDQPGHGPTDVREKCQPEKRLIKERVWVIGGKLRGVESKWFKGKFTK